MQKDAGSEVDIVITFIGEIGDWGFPLSHRRLKEHVDSICQAHLEDPFPVGRVGKNWTDHFVEKHSEAIKMLWSQPLERKHGQAVNPFTKEAFYELLGDTVKTMILVRIRLGVLTKLVSKAQWECLRG